MSRDCKVWKLLQAHSRKRDIKAFSGFAFDIETKVACSCHHLLPVQRKIIYTMARQKEPAIFFCNMQDTELERLEARLSKWTTPQLNSLLDLLDLPRGSGEDGVKVTSSNHENASQF